jgi:hypothetical protein
MKKSTKRLLGGLAIAGGALGAAGAVLMKQSKRGRFGRAARSPAVDVWARPGMNVTFRAEVMPGRDRAERTFRVKELLSSGRVLLHDAEGEHAQREFERIQ